MNARQIWRSLSVAGRDAALDDMAALWPSLSIWLAEPLAQVISYRASTLRRAPKDRAVGHLRQGIPRLLESHLENLLIQLHREGRTELLIALYDEFGISHDGPDLADDDKTVELAPDSCVVGALALCERFPQEHIWLCLALMAETGPEHWHDSLAAAREAVVSRDGTSDDGTSYEVPEADADHDDPYSTPEFSTLDRMLIRTVVSSLNEIEGALEFDRIDDLVQEVVELNDSRARSHFHRGFVDGLLNQEVQTQEIGDNRERRCWYVVGWLHGLLRKRAPDDVLQAIDKLEPHDRSLLFDQALGAGAMLAPEVVPRLLERGEIEQAEHWVDAHLIRCAPRLVFLLLAWSDDVLLSRGDAASVSSLLKSTLAQLNAIPEERPEAPSAELLRELERQRAIALRASGRQTEARALLMRLLEGAEDPSETARLQAQLGLVEIGKRFLESLELPAHEEEKEGLLSAIAEHREHFEAAAAPPEPSPIALFVLALPAVAAPGLADRERVQAADRLRLAIERMDDSDRPVWERSGLGDRARLYLSLLDLRSNQPGTYDAGAERLHRLLLAGVDAPPDLVLDAVANAILLGCSRAADVAELALQRFGHRAFNELDLKLLCTESDGFRQALTALLEESDSDLGSSEQWEAWEAIARGAACAQPRDLEGGGRALDALEGLAATAPYSEKLLKLLDERAVWDPAWSEEDASTARYQRLLRLGRLPDAASCLIELAHSEISRGADFAALELMEILRDELDVEPSLLAPLYARVRDPEQVPQAAPGTSTRPVKILFIGGNETQEAYGDRLVREIRDAEPGAIVDFEFTGWGANWGRLLSHLERRIDRSDAIVVMRFVRTNLGRAVRRLASKYDRPWVPCTGHGYASIQNAILRAIQVARLQQSGEE